MEFLDGGMASPAVGAQEHTKLVRANLSVVDAVHWHTSSQLWLRHSGQPELRSGSQYRDLHSSAPKPVAHVGMAGGNGNPVAGNLIVVIL